MADERVVFGNTFEGLYGFVKSRLPSDHLERFKALGVDFSQPLHPGYPADAYHHFVDAVAEMLHPEASRDERLRRIGRATVEGYSATLLGKAVRAGAMLIGTRRTLERRNRNFRTSDNYLQAQVTPAGEDAVEIALSDVSDRAAYYVGIFEAIVKLSGGGSPAVSLLDAEPPGARYRVGWTAKSAKKSRSA